jgi:hypothetical protein
MKLPAARLPVSAATACLLLALTGCASTGPAQPLAVPCNSELLFAANYLDDLADQRMEQLQLIRFGSEAAMNAYNEQTRRLRLEALRLGEVLVQLGEQSRLEPDYIYAQALQPTLEGAHAAIASADACVAAAQ